MSMRICKSTGVDWVTDEGYWLQSGWLVEPRLIKNGTKEMEEFKAKLIERSKSDE